MKRLVSFGALSLLAFSACSIWPHFGHPKGKAETVLITYHVKEGREGEFEDTLARAWKVYDGEHLVFANPHVIVREPEDKTKTRFVEIFTWSKSPDEAPESVKAMWKEEQALCEARDGKAPIEGGEVEMVRKK